MAEFILEAVLPLDERDRQHDGVAFEIVNGYSIVSIAVPKDGLNSLKKSFLSKFKTDLPGPGQFTLSSSGNGKLIAMQQNQLFYLWENSGEDALEMVANKLGNQGYYTDQSDSWVIVSVSGIHARKALERICPIDLFRDDFPVGSFARTRMEHLGVLIMCVGDDDYWLMSARSSAGSFLHAIETSISNVI